MGALEKTNKQLGKIVGEWVNGNVRTSLFLLLKSLSYWGYFVLEYFSWPSEEQSGLFLAFSLACSSHRDGIEWRGKRKKSAWLRGFEHVLFLPVPCPLLTHFLAHSGGVGWASMLQGHWLWQLLTSNCLQQRWNSWFFRNLSEIVRSWCPPKGRTMHMFLPHTYLSWHFEKDGCQMVCNWMSCICVSLKTES